MGAAGKGGRGGKLELGRPYKSIGAAASMTRADASIPTRVHFLEMPGRHFSSSTWGSKVANVYYWWILGFEPTTHEQKTHDLSMTPFVKRR